MNSKLKSKLRGNYDPHIIYTGMIYILLLAGAGDDGWIVCLIFAPIIFTFYQLNKL